MLLRTAMFGVILLAMQISFAEDSHTSHADVAGRVTQDGTREEQQILLQEKCVELDRLQREVQHLRDATGTAQQIRIKVQMLEVSLTKLRNMGTDTDWFSDGYVSGTKMQQLLDATEVLVPAERAESVTKAEANDSLRFVNWLKRKNLAKVLADPTVVVLSGRPASISIGGEFPLPANKDSKAVVDFRKFGTELELLALALGNNQVRLELKTRVSAIDSNHAIEISGVRVPGLKVRQCDTGCELSFGQTAVLTGLVQQRIEAQQDESGEVSEVINDVGLVVVVCPELVPLLEVPLASANHDISHPISK